MALGDEGIDAGNIGVGLIADVSLLAAPDSVLLLLSEGQDHIILQLLARLVAKLSLQDHKGRSYEMLP